MKVYFVLLVCFSYVFLHLVNKFELLLLLLPAVIFLCLLLPAVSYFYFFYYLLLSGVILPADLLLPDVFFSVFACFCCDFSVLVYFLV